MSAPDTLNRFELTGPQDKDHNKKPKRKTKPQQDNWSRFRELYLAVSVSAFLDRCMEEKYGKPRPR